MKKKCLVVYPSSPPPLSVAWPLKKMSQLPYRIKVWLNFMDIGQSVRVVLNLLWTKQVYNQFPTPPPPTYLLLVKSSLKFVRGQILFFIPNIVYNEPTFQAKKLGVEPDKALECALDILFSNNLVTTKAGSTTQHTLFLREKKAWWGAFRPPPPPLSQLVVNWDG